jgi:hypothetical protein
MFVEKPPQKEKVGDDKIKKIKIKIKIKKHTPACQRMRPQLAPLWSVQRDRAASLVSLLKQGGVTSNQKSGSS